MNLMKLNRGGGAVAGTPSPTSPEEEEDKAEWRS